MKHGILRILLTLAVTLAPGALFAQAAANYVVRDVPISASAADATSARMQAMTDGEVIGFEKLLSQILPPEEAAMRFKTMDKSRISPMVRSYEVREEKLSASSYEAKLDLTFDEKQVSAFLANNAASPVMSNATAAMGTPPSSVNALVANRGNTKSTVLVLPVERRDNAELLWEENNSWRQVWNSVDRAGTSFIRLPIGDQSDQAMIQGAQAKAAPFEAFSLIADRYQAATVLVAEAVYSLEPNADKVDVNLRSLGAGGQLSEITLTYNAEQGETMQTLLSRAAQDIATRLLSEGQEQSQVQADAQNKVTVLTRLNGVGDWVTLRRRLLGIPNVEKVELSAISEQQADMVLYFKGNPEALAASLAAQGLQVNRAYNYWVIAF